jgi:hypothetical protein
MASLEHDRQSPAASKRGAGWVVINQGVPPDCALSDPLTQFLHFGIVGPYFYFEPRIGATSRREQGDVLVGYAGGGVKAAGFYGAAQNLQRTSK